MVENKIIIDLKAAENLIKILDTQLVHYLKANAWFFIVSSSFDSHINPFSLCDFSY